MKPPPPMPLWYIPDNYQSRRFHLAVIDRVFLTNDPDAKDRPDKLHMALAQASRVSRIDYGIGSVPSRP